MDLVFLQCWKIPDRENRGMESSPEGRRRRRGGCGVVGRPVRGLRDRLLLNLFLPLRGRKSFGHFRQRAGLVGGFVPWFCRSRLTLNHWKDSFVVSRLRTLVAHGGLPKNICTS